MSHKRTFNQQDPKAPVQSGSDNDIVPWIDSHDLEAEFVTGM